MFVDASAIVAMLTREPEADALTDLLQAAKVRPVPITAEDAQTALVAFGRYGKGGGHPAQLNLGDCFACAVAKEPPHRAAVQGRRLRQDRHPLGRRTTMIRGCSGAFVPRPTNGRYGSSIARRPRALLVEESRPPLNHAKFIWRLCWTHNVTTCCSRNSVYQLASCGLANQSGKTGHWPVFRRKH